MSPAALVLLLASLSFDPVQAAPVTPDALAAGPSTSHVATLSAGAPGVAQPATALHDAAVRTAVPLPVRLASAAPASDAPSAAAAERPTITSGSGALAALGMLAWIVARRPRRD